MVPVYELLSRIRWDKEFGKGNFKIGYYDNVEQRVIVVSLQDIRFEQGNRFSFELQTSEGEVITIPLHRIREVYKDGTLIWSRPSMQKDSHDEGKL